jgi:ribosomal protein S18 acetylase RimI-like enzyme
MSELRISMAWKVLRKEGLRSFWFKLIDVLGYRRLFLLSRSLEKPIPAVEAKISLALSWLTSAETGDYLAFRPTTDAIKLAKRFERHERCLAARSPDGRLVGVMWVARHRARIEYLEEELPLADDEVYLFDAFTDPTLRGRAIAPALSTELLRRLHAEGCRVALRGTLPENTAALKAHAKAGFQIIGLAARMKLGPWRRSWRRELR